MATERSPENFVETADAVVTFSVDGVPLPQRRKRYFHPIRVAGMNAAQIKRRTRPALKYWSRPFEDHEINVVTRQGSQESRKRADCLAFARSES